ncbi:MAG: DUF2889 domain-containing protein [Actinobacteria bacterium]|nr:DUF2889 domain-containing protein [Actinomycetota bacterium]
MGIFRREIYFDVDECDGDRIFITGTLRDTRLEEPIHFIVVRAVVGMADGLIHSLEAEMQHIPHEDCHHALLTLSRLVGERIVPGFTQKVRDIVGSPAGCSHLAALVTDLGHVSVQGRGAVAMEKFGNSREALSLVRKHAKELEIMGNCYTWREDGPLMKQVRAETERAAEGSDGESRGG